MVQTRSHVWGEHVLGWDHPGIVHYILPSIGDSFHCQVVCYCIYYRGSLRFLPPVKWNTSEIKSISFSQSKPLFSVEPGAGYLFRVRWSPSRPLVFSVVTADGRLLIYDLKVSENVHAPPPKPGKKSLGTRLTSLVSCGQFNKLLLV